MSTIRDILLATMEFIPIKTRIFTPPQDDLYAVLDEYLVDVRDDDIVLISSKVVAIGEGRCVKIGEAHKANLVKEEADYLLPTDYRTTPLTIKNHLFIGAAGIDESNSDGHYVLLPEDSFASAHAVHEYLQTRFKLKNVGVIITDSRSLPLRYGAIGAALAWWGMAPLEDHIGNCDLFGRAFKYERSNIVDGIAAGANLVSGETDECQPVVIARGVPGIVFKDGDTRNELFSPLEDDTFRVLYRNLL